MYVPYFNAMDDDQTIRQMVAEALRDGDEARMQDLARLAIEQNLDALRRLGLAIAEAPGAGPIQDMLAQAAQAHEAELAAHPREHLGGHRQAG